MSPDKKKVEELAALAAKLNRETDSLNDLFLSLETQLSSMNLGVTVWVDPFLEDGEVGRLLESSVYRDEDNENKFFEGYQIGYAKIGTEWRIAVRNVRFKVVAMTYTNGEDIVPDDMLAPPIPVVQASRLVRTEAAGMLDTLVEVLASQAKTYLDTITKAKEQFSK